jgi:hypothetical protein
MDIGKHCQPALLLLAALAFTAAPGQAQESSNEAVLNVVTALFDGMREKNAEALASLFLDEGRLGTHGVDEWIAQVSSSNAYLDEVTFDEVVLVDGTMAMAWTPYNLFVDGQFHHCGVDLFALRKVDGAWKILQLDDTRRSAGCDATRRGK